MAARLRLALAEERQGCKQPLQASVGVYTKYDPSMCCARRWRRPQTPLRSPTRVRGNLPHWRKPWQPVLQHRGREPRSREGEGAARRDEV